MLYDLRPPKSCHELTVNVFHHVNHNFWSSDAYGFTIDMCLITHRLFGRSCHARRTMMRFLGMYVWHILSQQVKFNQNMSSYINFIISQPMVHKYVSTRECHIRFTHRSECHPASGWVGDAGDVSWLMAPVATHRHTQWDCQYKFDINYQTSLLFAHWYIINHRVQEKNAGFDV